MLKNTVFWGVFDSLIILIEFSVLYYIVNTFSDKDTSGKYRNISFIVMVSFLIIMLLLNILPDIRALVAIGASFLFYKKNYVVEIKKCFMIVLVFWTLSMSLESLSMVAIMHLNSLNDLKLVIYKGVYRLELIVLSKTLLIISASFCNYFRFLGKITIKEFLYIAIPIITNVFSLFIIFGSGIGDFENRKVSNVIVFFIAILLLISNISLIFIIQKIIKDNKLILEHKLRNKRNDMEYNYYIKIEENNLKVRRLYHDMKNHLMCIATLCDNEESKNYVKSLNFELNKLDNSFNTGNKVLDIILSEKKSICIEKEIDITSYVDFSKSDFMEMDDVCTIFSNSLDNAIEACDKIDNKKIKKKIDIKVKYIKGFCLIKITNTKINKIVSRNNKIITDKKDGFFHGIGLLNIKDVVERYNGELSVDFTDNEFILTIIIPTNMKNIL
jgi:hypothetical protein